MVSAMAKVPQSIHPAQEAAIAAGKPDFAVPIDCGTARASSARQQSIGIKRTAVGKCCQA
jgi:hypothetical protein